MSLGQLASAVGRSSSSVRRWERGEVAPAVSVVPKLAAILELEPEALSHDADGDGPDSAREGWISTVEQPVVADAEPVDEQKGQVPEPVKKSDDGILADFWKALSFGGRGWVGWARGLLTTAILFVMLLVLLWAVGEFFDAISAVLDSFEVGTGGEQP